MILFVTPCYGGKAEVPWVKSIVQLQEALLSAGVEHDFLITTGESLVQRARNTSVATFLRSPYKKLMFIDSDIEFSPEDVSRLWNMDAPVAVGLYPMKRKDLPLSAWRNGQLIRKLPKETFEVDYAGTGFMMIDRSVFEEMKDAYPERLHEEGNVGSCFSWFDPRVDDGIYLSEDYAFCKDWRDIGGKILADPSIKLIHHGSYGYGSEVA